MCKIAPYHDVEEDDVSAGTSVEHLAGVRGGVGASAVSFHEFDMERGVLREKAARKEMRVDSLYSGEMKSGGALIE